MKASIVVSFVCILIQFSAIGQTNIFAPNDDSLTFLHVTGGIVDTFDLKFSFPLTTLPGGQLGFYNGVPTVDFYRNSSSLLLHPLPALKKSMTFSALPHLGFFYSFGTKGAQFVHADYQQAFKNNSLLNLTIDRSSSAKQNSMTRNGGFSSQSVEGAYRFNQKRIQGQLHATYLQNENQLNGGISNDSSWLEQGIAFAPVLKGNANSLQKSFHAEGNFKYSLLQDSAFLRAGITTKHNFSLRNRVYNEQDSLFKFYGNLFIDSTTTRDQFQEAKLKNSVGLFVENQFFSLSVFGAHRYWRFQNLGTNQSKNETSADVDFGIRFKKITASSQNYINLSGAENEFYSKSNLKWGGETKYISAGASFESMLPELFQRFYFGNNLAYNTLLTKQNRNDIHITAAYSFWKIESALTVGSLSWRDNLIWSADKWDFGAQSNQTVNYLKAKFHFNLNWFQAYPEIQYQAGSEFLPNVLVSGRILVKKKIFAAKKLELSFAIDPQLTSEYQFMTYNTLLDNWYFDANNRSGGQRFILHSTFTLHIEEFKFFVRTENIQSFWTKNNIEIAQRYYRPPFLLRLGISWDFYN